MNDNFHIAYLINSRDEIIFVNDRWSHFADANSASSITRENILQRNLWNFINNRTIEDVYREILRQVRAGQSMQINLRCDAPNLRRLVELTISPQPNGNVLFDSRTIWTEARPAQIILTKDVSRSADLLLICSWCNKLDTGKENWQEVEEAVKTLGLFEIENLPLISHGMCFVCHQEMLEKLKSNHS